MMYITKKSIIVGIACFIGGAALGNFIGKNRTYHQAVTAILESQSDKRKENTPSTQTNTEES